MGLFILASWEFREKGKKAGDTVGTTLHLVNPLCGLTLGNYQRFFKGKKSSIFPRKYQITKSIICGGMVFDREENPDELARFARASASPCCSLV
jgi:hypothetical protein